MKQSRQGEIFCVSSMIYTLIVFTVSYQLNSYSEMKKFSVCKMICLVKKNTKKQASNII